MAVFSKIGEFPSPAPVRASVPVLPVFIPFSGCPVRCVFCAQDVQTGVEVSDVASALRRADEALEARKAKAKPPCELAFFGGTFTALDPADFTACLRFAEKWLNKGTVCSVRCSTRPDRVEAVRLKALVSAGFGLVELGIQSFSAAALAASNRGYTPAQAGDGCRKVLDAGLSLGIQLMPGMPGATIASALEDVAMAASFAPSCARLYPCLVIEGTGLARLWRQGTFIPLQLDAAVELLARSCLLLWEKDIPVIRMGLADDAALAQNVLAGPRHPDIGGMAKGLALLYYLSQAIDACTNTRQPGQTALFVPRIWQGAFWGNRGTLESRYAEIGLTRDTVRFHDQATFLFGSFQKA